MTLLELFARHNYQTDKLHGHSYIPVYEELFAPRKESTRNVLEIGIARGGSLHLWHDYFENAQIYGIDNRRFRKELAHHERIHQIQADAYSADGMAASFAARGIQFDIIIDDGPHNKTSQTAAMELYFPLLADDGMIIIEDVQDYMNPGVWIHDIIRALPRDYRKFARIIDLRHLGVTPDDLLIVLDKSQIGPQRSKPSTPPPFPSYT